ncbi:MAG: hypothetical protein Q9162_004872 [Coniocarpon cinnabarinum]
MVLGLFGNAGKPRGPADICRATKQSLQKLIQTTDQIQAVSLDDDIARFTDDMKMTLAGSRDRQVPNQDQNRMVTSMCEEDLFYNFAVALPKISFERRKGVQVVLASAIRFKRDEQEEKDLPRAVKHIFQDRPQVMIQLCKCFEHNDCAMPVSGILQEALKFDSLTAIILYDEPGRDIPALHGANPNTPGTGNGLFWRMFRYIDRSSFEASAAAFETFRQILTLHRTLSQHFLRVNAPLFFSRYHSILMQSASYVTKRQSIKLLADILLDRTHYDLMSGYVKDHENLKLAMNLLRDSRRMIAYEAFHIFKIFVADPDKSYQVLKILIMNKQRLTLFLEQFLAERDEEGQFADEKAYCLSVIRGLPDKTPQRENSDLLDTLRPASYGRRSQRMAA